MYGLKWFIMYIIQEIIIQILFYFNTFSKKHENL
jgi:hypothetical protein